MMGRAIDPEHNGKAVRFQPSERMTAKQIVWGAYMYISIPNFIQDLPLQQLAMTCKLRYHDA